MNITNNTILIILILSTSCAVPRYMKKKEKVLKGSYQGDSLILQNYYFYHEVTNSWGVVQDCVHSFTDDSVFNVFGNSIQKLKLNIDIDKRGRNMIDESFHFNWRRPFDSELEGKIISSTAHDNRLYLVPMFKIGNNYQSGMYFTSSGGVGGSRYLMRGILDMVIYIIRNNSVLYSRSAFSISQTEPAYEMCESIHTLTQKDWDELVALVMKDYVERLRE